MDYRMMFLKGGITKEKKHLEEKEKEKMKKKEEKGKK